MKVVVAAVSSNRSLSGVSRHAANLAKCLLIRPEISALHVLVARWEEGCVKDAICRNDPRLHVHPVPMRPGTLARNLWYLQTLPAIVQQLHADVVHVSYPSLITASAFLCPTVATLHDLYPYDIPANFGLPKVFFNRMILRQCLRNAGAIACVSEATRRRLCEVMPNVAEKAVTIGNFAESGPSPRKPAFAASWNGEPFLLCVAQHRRNKNLLLALKVFRRALAAGDVSQRTRLLVVGLAGPESGALYRFARAENLDEAVVFVNGLSDAELAWCYRNAELLLAPSLIEGFGLPVLEAQLAGCRVVCSDIPSFREVASPASRFVPLDSNAEEKFVVAVGEALRARRPIPANMPRLSPSPIAKQYIELYGRVIARRGRGEVAEVSLQRAPNQGSGETARPLSARASNPLRP
ncbi:glycosyltransferase family 4 protein [Occallatibacter savannae]|uniref:glycosyltransferase family 4 protein n=1 Tax=Occallatibacter savannae TaxID=1002691 RepID=UPI000D699A16|nr:glycosyltransferase family 1 protein [Occallatibacter savannae]